MIDLLVVLAFKPSKCFKYELIELITGDAVEVGDERDIFSCLLWTSLDFGGVLKGILGDDVPGMVIFFGFSLISLGVSLANDILRRQAFNNLI